MAPPAIISAVRIVFMGTPEFAVEPLKRLASEHEVAAVYTREDKPAGRGREVAQSPVKREAVSLGLRIEQPATLKSEEVLSRLAAIHPEIIIVCAYGRILPEAVLGLPPYRCLNIHPSLLPRHRGASPVASTILSGDAWGGVSIMLMDPGLDTGPVLTRAPVLVRDSDTAGSLAGRLSLVSAYLIVDLLPGWVAGEVKPEPQDDSRATYFKTVRKEAGEIDWRLPSVEIWRRIRALQPWPGAYTFFRGKSLKILEASPCRTETQGTPGCVVEATDGFGVVTGDGVLKALRVQLEGKQAVNAAEFERGQRQLVGSVLGAAHPEAGCG
jgi:methionyl-tRNA formyltransferase